MPQVQYLQVLMEKIGHLLETIYLMLNVLRLLMRMAYGLLEDNLEQIEYRMEAETILQQAQTE
jgi:hypothetical protein